MTDASHPGPASPRVAAWWRSPRTVAENLATLLIVAGIIMLMQPVSIEVYGYSFVVTLAGTVLFIVGSKFPE